MNVWTVTCDYVKGVLTYFVENKVTGERRGTFDCEPWAKEMADELNREGGRVMAKLCMYNDCKAGEHEYSIRCCDCPETDCPERCPNKNCESCYWMTEVKDGQNGTEKENG